MYAISVWMLILSGVSSGCYLLGFCAHSPLVPFSESLNHLAAWLKVKARQKWVCFGNFD